MARFYITDLGFGCITKTNDEGVAESYALSEDYFVVDTRDDCWIQADMTRAPIAEAIDPT